MENKDFRSLVEARVILEVQSAQMAAERRTAEDIISMESALVDHKQKVLSKKTAIEEDLIFHLTIAEASKNNVLKSLMMVIMPDIIDNIVKLKIYTKGRAHRALQEHEVILQHIIDQEPERAAVAMKAHLKEIIDYSQNGY